MKAAALQIGETLKYTIIAGATLERGEPSDVAQSSLGEVIFAILVTGDKVMPKNPVASRSLKQPAEVCVWHGT